MLNDNLFKQLLVNVTFRLETLLLSTWKNMVTQISFLPVYYSRNELLWVDGFLIDFLQKKTADLWIRKFVIYTGFLFSERLVFESVVRIYLDNLIWPAHLYSTFESDNVSSMLSNILYVYFAFILLLLTIFTTIYLF